MNRFRRVLFLGLNLAAAGVLSRAADATNEVSAFPDKNLEKAVRRQVFEKRENDKPITAADVANISTINGNFLGISDLTGLEHCKAIASIDLAGNRIVNLGPLQGLKQLQYLNLASNLVKDVTPLGTVPALQYIELSHNQVADIGALSTCTNLASLYLSDNSLTSLSAVTNLPRLVTLYADGNKLKSIAGVENLKWLTSVSLSRNELKDITPLTALRAPTFFLLEQNKIRDLAPLYRAATNDFAGQKNWSPFLNLYLKGNPLSSKSKKQLDELKKQGMRVNL